MLKGKNKETQSTQTKQTSEPDSITAETLEL